jgi:glyoxalase/bleomycin resistance protein/dioxygenase superfamily protein
MWAAVQVVDYDAVVWFYRCTLGLPVVDGWSDAASVGTIFAIGGSARLEIESATSPGAGVSIALEYPSLDALTEIHGRIRDATPIEKHGRGHHSFTALDPASNEIYLWSEK